MRNLGDNSEVQSARQYVVDAFVLFVLIVFGKMILI